MKSKYGTVTALSSDTAYDMLFMDVKTTKTRLYTENIIF